MIQIAVIGDVHGHFDAADVIYFNQSSYDLLLFVGDLATYWHWGGVLTARQVARLQKPTLFIPGNHDTVTLWQLLAEIKGWTPFTWLFSLGQPWRVRSLRRALGPVVYGGYETHSFAWPDASLDVITARPYSMGGNRLNYRHQLQRQFGVRSLADSAERLRQCVDAAPSNRLIFLAHNGPTGLGQKPGDIWGCDFEPEAGDFGDLDLAEGIAYARERGKQVLAVVAGHMHHRLKEGGQRQWCVERAGAVYVNAARAPRIFEENGRTVRHHVRLTLDGDTVSVTQQLVPDG